MPLRIFAALPRSAWVELNLRRTLEELGHELIVFDFPGWPDDADPRWQRVGKPRTNQRLLERFRAALHERPIDLFYGYLYSSVVYPETLREIGRSGVPTVNFSCNNVHQFGLVESIAPCFDLCVVPERAALASYAAVGARAARIQLAANPRVYRPYPLPRQYDVTFVGQRYADRADFLWHLHQHGVQVRAWGAGWQARKSLSLATVKAGLALFEDEGVYGLRRVLGSGLAAGAARVEAGWRSRPGSLTLASSLADARVASRVPDPTRDPGPATRDHSTTRPLDLSTTRPLGLPFGGPRLMHRDLVRLFSQSHISLGFATAGDSHLGPRRLTHLRLREFEAPMSGALYLTEQQDELAEYFEVGHEVLAYTDKDDLLDQVRYYLGHPEQAERVRHNGHRRAVREHTWRQRFGELFAALGFKA